MRELLASHQQALQEPVGVAGDWLVRAQTLAGQEARKRDQESPADSLFADILREETRADVALLPGVGYGVAIPPGPITAAQLRQLIPHDGRVFTMQLAGAQIRDILEQSVENTFSDDPATKVGGMIQVSGIRFRFDPVVLLGASRGVSSSIRRLGPRPQVPGCHEFSARARRAQLPRVSAARTSRKGRLSTR